MSGWRQNQQSATFITGSAFSGWDGAHCYKSLHETLGCILKGKERYSIISMPGTILVHYTFYFSSQSPMKPTYWHDPAFWVPRDWSRRISESLKPIWATSYTENARMDNTTIPCLRFFFFPETRTHHVATVVLELRNSPVSPRPPGTEIKGVHIYTQQQFKEEE